MARPVRHRPKIPKAKALISFTTFSYIYAMVLVPIVENPSWEYLQSVWHDWQTLNAAMIALFSSSIFYQGTLNAKKEEFHQRRRYEAGTRFLITLDLRETYLEVCDFLEHCFEHYLSRLDSFNDRGLAGITATPTPPDYRTRCQAYISKAWPMADGYTIGFLVHITDRLVYVMGKPRKKRDLDQIVDGLVELLVCKTSWDIEDDFFTGKEFTPYNDPFELELVKETSMATRLSEQHPFVYKKVISAIENRNKRT